jgi:hypothetical protein
VEKASEIYLLLVMLAGKRVKAERALNACIRVLLFVCLGLFCKRGFGFFGSFFLNCVKVFLSFGLPYDSF